MKRFGLALRRSWRGEDGQALTETALLCFLILVAGAGANALIRRHPEMLDALNLYVRSFYFALSLPFP